MNNHVVEDLTFISRLGSSLERFHSTGKNVWNCRCPICGDSSHNRYKARGYILQNREGNFYFFCHNCGCNLSLKKFLEEVNLPLYQEYVAALLTSKQKSHLSIDKVEVKSFGKSVLERHLKPIASLPDSHPAVQYLLGRSVPKSVFPRLFWTDTWKELTQEPFFDGKYKEDRMMSSGIVFPLFTRDIRLSGFQLRSIEATTKAYRFQTVVQGEEGFFGLDVFKRDVKAYVVEGCTDSLFLPNCVAVLNSKLARFDFPGATYIQDQEPRNKAVVEQIEACIRKGYTIVLLPEKYYGMDVNDIYKSVGSQVRLLELIKKYSFQGMKAKMQLATWRRC